MTDIFSFSKDGSFLLKLHRNMRREDQEHECLEVLRRQLSVFKRVINTSKEFMATVQPDSARLEIASECFQDADSIALEAEASISVVGGLISRAGYESSSRRTISYTV